MDGPITKPGRRELEENKLLCCVAKHVIFQRSTFRNKHILANVLEVGGVIAIHAVTNSSADRVIYFSFLFPTSGGLTAQIYDIVTYTFHYYSFI